MPPDPEKLLKEVGDAIIARTNENGFARRSVRISADQCPHCRGERLVRGHTDDCALDEYLELTAAE